MCLCVHVYIHTCTHIYTYIDFLNILLNLTHPSKMPFRNSLILKMKSVCICFLLCLAVQKKKERKEEMQFSKKSSPNSELHFKVVGKESPARCSSPRLILKKDAQFIQATSHLKRLEVGTTHFKGSGRGSIQKRKPVE